MYKGKRVAAVVLAAGQGQRMGSEIPKQYLEIEGVPMAFHSVHLFSSLEFIDQVILVTNKEWIEFCQEQLKGDKGIHSPKIKVVAGGDERGGSTLEGLRAVSEEVDYVLIHDGARPYVSKNLVQQVIESTLKTGATIPAVIPKDTIRYNGKALPRQELYSIQTPQGFRKDIIFQAYKKGNREGFLGTDDAAYVERLGKQITIIKGEYSNKKITTKEDLPMSMFTGMGYDVHGLGEGRKLVLGGVEIPWGKGLVGHSDADVLVHAIMDAMLGAAGLGDIGEHFPDQEEQYMGISSLLLLKNVKEKVSEKGFSMVNIDGTIIAQAPKIGAYKEEMRANIAKVLDMQTDRVNIKATTTEHLGFVGRQEGIAAMAVCTVESKCVVDKKREG